MPEDPKLNSPDTDDVRAGHAPSPPRKKRRSIKPPICRHYIACEKRARYWVTFTARAELTPLCEEHAELWCAGGAYRIATEVSK